MSKSTTTLAKICAVCNSFRWCSNCTKYGVVQGQYMYRKKRERGEKKISGNSKL